jgi:hypothetical protein
VISFRGHGDILVKYHCSLLVTTSLAQKKKKKKKTLRYDQKYFFNGYNGINININI